MAGYSSASLAIGVLFSDCITKDTPPPFTSPNTTFGYTPASGSPFSIAERIRVTSFIAGVRRGRGVGPTSSPVARIAPRSDHRGGRLLQVIRPPGREIVGPGW